MRSFLAGLRRLIIPWGAADDQPRIVISTDDPLSSDFNNAAVSFYWDRMRGFVIGVERSGDGPSAWGQWRLYGLAPNDEVDGGQGLSQFIDVSYVPDDSEGDSLILSGGTRAAQNAQISLRGSLIEIGEPFASHKKETDVRLYGASLPRGRHAKDSTEAAISGIGATATVVHSIPPTTFIAGRAYEVRMFGGISASAANVAGDFRIRRTGGGNFAEFYRIPCPVASTVYAANATGARFRVGTSANLTAGLEMTLAAVGAGTVTHFAAVDRPRRLEVWDIGAASEFSDAILLT